MERGISDKNILEDFTIKFCKIIDKHVKYIVVSGFVAIAHGRSRSTEDIDMIIERIPKDKFIEMHKDIVNGDFQCIQSDNVDDIYDYIDGKDSIRYVKKGTFLPPEMEVKFAKDEIDKLQLLNRKKLPFTGLDIWFSSIEDNIAFKEELLKGPKDYEDAKHLRFIYKGKIDEESIKRIKKMIRTLRLKELDKRWYR